MNKRKTWTFAINPGKKFGRNFVIFEKILLVWRFCWFFFSISALVWLSVLCKKVLTQKLLYLNKCPGLLISNLRYLQNWENGSVLEVVLTSFRSTINHVSNKYNTTGFIFAQYTWTIYEIPSLIAFLKVYSEYLNVSVANCECQKNRSFSITKILKGLYFVIGMVMVNDTNRFLTKLEFSII